MRRLLALILVLALALAAGCGKTVEIKEPLLNSKGKPVYDKAGKPLYIERKTTVADQGRAAQLALGHQIVAGIKTGQIPMGRTITHEPIDNTKPTNARLVIKDVDPAVAKAMLAMADFSNYKDPKNFIDMLIRFVEAGERIGVAAVNKAPLGMAFWALKSAAEKTTYQVSGDYTGGNKGITGDGNIQGVTPGRDANIGQAAGSDREKPPPEETEPGATEPVEGEE